MRTTNLEIADMYAVVLLKIERAGFDAAAARGLTVPDGLDYSAADIDREHRLGRSAMYFFYPGVSDDVMKKAYACNSHFRCSALMEGLGAHVRMSQDSSAFSSLIDGAGCNTELIHWIRGTPVESSGDTSKSFGEPGALERSLTTPWDK